MGQTKGESNLCARKSQDDDVQLGERLESVS